MTAELHLVDSCPYAHHVRSIHTDHQLTQRRIRQMGYGAGGASVVRLAVTDDAIIRGDSHYHGVTLHGATESQINDVFGRQFVRHWVGSHIGDSHGFTPVRWFSEIL